MKPEHVNEIKGIALFSFALILLASLLSYVPTDLPWFTSHPNQPIKNLIGILGAYGAGSFLWAFGYSVYFLVLFCFFWSWNIFTSRAMFFTPVRVTFLVLFLIVMSSLFSLIGSPGAADRFDRGGIVGMVFVDFLVANIQILGAYILLFALAATCLVMTAEVLISPLLVKATRALIGLWQYWRAGGNLFKFFPVGGVKKVKAPLAVSKPKSRDEDQQKNVKTFVKQMKAKASEEEEEEEEEDDDEIPEVVKPVKPEPKKPMNIRIIKPSEEVPREREDKPLVLGNYKFPTFDLLNDPAKVEEGNLHETVTAGAKILEKTLLNFGIVATVVDAERGPVVTKYELEPAAGVRVQQITTLSDDIALAMQAASVRIQAPIPGKNRVGIEVPNGLSAAVVLKDVLIEGDIRNAKSKITLALGKDTSGRPIIADLAEMPHLLVAGSTGSGKSVCLNVIIMSILYNAAPNEVKFIMIDPKMVELNQYNDLPHMLIPAITDHKKVAPALGWVLNEMESRYKTLMKHQVRNIKAYHQKGFEMPYIVVIVDEFADLMQVSGKVIESAITRLAQLARAVGIHLILATQRPSVNVITGVIKANLPSRIAFRTMQMVDSRTILDEKGAEDLLGKGDMLFIRPGDPKPIRGQCSYLSDEEIHRVMDFIRVQAKPEYDMSVIAKPAGSGAGEGAGEKDELYEEAVGIVMQTGQASVSVLQRRLSLGYSRAGRILDAMEQSGLVGPHAGSKARDILVDREQWIAEHSGVDPKALEAIEPPEEKA